MTKANLQTLRERARLLQLIRMFFLDRGYLEVDTALLCPTLIPEGSLEVFRTCYRSANGPDRDVFLIPSPELWMKRLIAEGSESIFQICKSFRNSEPAIPLHNPEFTMLEWYTLAADYLQSMDTMEELYAHLFEKTDRDPVLTLGDLRVDCSPPFLRLSMAEAFQEHLRVDLRQLGSRGALGDAVRSLGLTVTPEDRSEDLFHKLFLTAVEPNLPHSRPVILYDYPALIPTLARNKPGTPWAERWELYLAGVEVANCFSEETDAERIETFFRDQEKKKRQGLEAHPSDWELLRIIRNQGLPKCSGVALGLERLLLFFLNSDSIHGVLPYGADLSG
jgi:lysyl-tRNA synthetase class 2